MQYVLLSGEVPGQFDELLGRSKVVSPEQHACHEDRNTRLQNETKACEPSLLLRLV